MPLEHLILLPGGWISSSGCFKKLFKKGLSASKTRQKNSLCESQMKMRPYMKSKQWVTLIICAVCCLLSVENGLSQEVKAPLTGHVFYGRMNIAHNDPDLEEDDFDIPIFGVDAQKALGGGTFKYGFETGVLFSIDSDVRTFAASSGSGGGKVAVSVDVNSFLVDYFAGGYLSFEPAKWLRLNVGAGPLLIWSQWETEPEASTADEVTYQSDSGLGVGVYARAGLDLFFTEKVGLNIGARISETTLSLKNTTGEVDIEGWQYYCGIAVHF